MTKEITDDITENHKIIEQYKFIEISSLSIPRDKSTNSINIIWDIVFIFPNTLAVHILSCLDKTILNIEMQKSLDSNIIKAQTFKRFIFKKHDKTEKIKILSAIGSSILPISVTSFFILAKKPSKKSVNERTKNRKNDGM